MVDILKGKLLRVTPFLRNIVGSPVEIILKGANPEVDLVALLDKYDGKEVTFYIDDNNLTSKDEPRSELDNLISEDDALFPESGNKSIFFIDGNDVYECSLNGEKMLVDKTVLNNIFENRTSGTAAYVFSRNQVEIFKKMFMAQLELCKNMLKKHSSLLNNDIVTLKKYRSYGIISDIEYQQFHEIIEELFGQEGEYD